MLRIINIQFNQLLTKQLSLTQNQYHPIYIFKKTIYSMNSPNKNIISPTQKRTSQQIFFKTDPEIDPKKSFQQTFPKPQNEKYMNIQSKYQINHFLESNLSSNRVLSRLEERMLNRYNNLKYAATTPEDYFKNGQGEVVTYEGKNYGSDQQINKLIQFNQPYNSPPNNKQSFKSSQPQRIHIQKTLVKPKFGFKNMVNQTIDNTCTKDQLISFDSSSINGLNRASDCSLNLSKSASNFSDVLKIQDDKVNLRVIKNGDLQGYMLSKIDKKQQNISKRLQQIKKNNQIYDTKIRQKQRQIELVKKRMQKQHKQLQKYQSKMVQAYDNVDQNPDCLLISSRNYESSNTKMQARINKKTKIACFFQGMPKKLSKQILYGKCKILQTDLIQIGFDNTTKPGLIQLYLTIKQNLLQISISIQNAIQNGYVLKQEDFMMVTHHVPAGKKIKLKIYLDYVGSLRDRLGFMFLNVGMKINENSVFKEKVILPFSLYRNFITENIPTQQLLKRSQKKSLTIPQNYDYKIVTQWQNSCDQFIKNPKSYLQSIFKSGKWIEDNIYHIDLIFKQTIIKPINILVNCRNFAIEMNQTSNMDVVMAIGNFQTRYKDKEGSRTL